MGNWGFYGREKELVQLQAMLGRRRFFFAKVTGRRRIGKTALIREALHASHAVERIFYVQIPDSGPAGVISSVHDAMETFAIPPVVTPPPHTLDELAQAVSRMARAGYVVALDEFQYFNRERLRPFTSYLQREVDTLLASSGTCPGGIIVLGSIHAEIEALLNDRAAPLFQRTTDELNLGHLDIASLGTLLRAHADTDPRRLLFLWTLFEGVPKFYRDCFEHGVLRADRREVLRSMFFESGSPLRTEADTWFLKELHGRYDVVLKYVAKHPGRQNADVEAHVRNTSRDEKEQVAGYLKILIERYGLLEKKLPVFPRKSGGRASVRGARYYLNDNFLTAWLAALVSPVQALSFSPVQRLVESADARLVDVEGHALERLVAQLYQERSRKGVGDFSLTSRITGYWNNKDTEIDLVAMDDDNKRIRFGTVKRSADKLVGDVAGFQGHVTRFLAACPAYASYHRELVGFTVEASADVRNQLKRQGMLCEDLADLTRGLT